MRQLGKPTPELLEQYKSVFAPETVIGQYTFGTEEGSVSQDAEIHLVDSDHFALESCCGEIAGYIKKRIKKLL